LYQSLFFFQNKIYEEENNTSNDRNILKTRNHSTFLLKKENEQNILFREFLISKKPSSFLKKNSKVFPYVKLF